MIGAIKLISEQNCDGCVMADDGGVIFFHRACVERGYQPKIGDRVTFQTRVSPGSGGQEAYQSRLRSSRQRDLPHCGDLQCTARPTLGNELPAHIGCLALSKSANLVSVAHLAPYQAD